MTEKENILKKVIEKAKANGWEDPEGLTVIQIENSVFLLKSYAPKHIFFDINEILFDHSFCKAFFKDSCWLCTNNIAGHIKHDDLSWMQYIQQLALAEDRLKYLSGYI